MTTEVGSSGGIPQRLRFEKSWWVASEFLRRHPNYTVVEDHFGGIYDLLVLETRDPDVASTIHGTSPRVMLNRAGTIQVHDAGTEGQAEVVATWDAVSSLEDPHEIIRMIERASNLKPPPKSAKTDATLLVYRTLSAALTRRLNDHRDWDVRTIDESGSWVWTVGPIRPGLESFASAFSDHVFVHHRSTGHAWYLLRGDEPVAATSNGGICHFRAAPALTLMDLYSRRRRLDDVVDELFVRIDGLSHH